MSHGWAGQILIVKLDSGKTRRLTSQAYVKKFLGGRMLSARLAWDFLPPGTGPMDPANPIIISTGPLCGTIAPTSGRTVMSMVSPVPYPIPWYTHSTLGGWFGPQLKFAGYDALIITGAASEPVWLDICDQEVSIHPAKELWGLDALATQEAIQTHNPHAQVMCIGPAGENQVAWATVQHDFDCAAGHSGFGAVWGSKRLKAVAVRGTGQVRVAHPDQLLEEWRKTGKYTLSPEHAFMRYSEEKGKLPGNAEVGPVCSQSCVNNCRAGKYLVASDGHKIETFCIGHLFSGFLDTAYQKPGIKLKVPPSKQYPYGSTIGMIELFNKLGVDFWMRITMQPWFTALKHAGVDWLRGSPIDPDDYQWFSNFVNDLASGRGLGKIFAPGLARALDDLADELPEHVLRLGKEMVSFFGFQAHREGRFWDRTPLPYWIISAMMYISESRDPTIGSHGLLLLSEIQAVYGVEGVKDKFRVLAKKVWDDPQALEPDYHFERKAKLAIWSQRNHMLIDSLPMCDFSFPRLVKPLASWEEWVTTADICGDLDLDRRLLNAVTGESYTRASLNLASDRAFNIERCLLARAGRTRKLEERLASHFNLPNRDDDSKMSSKEFHKMMDVYYMHRGWDLKDGWPRKETLINLGLEDVAEELEVMKASKTDG
ncbi:MAG: hypothetical protein JRJ51_24910 [Deltaproteobacteria bacterium]|nr:hypothetical protein [Deltaproteobacteria bacterium]